LFDTDDLVFDEAILPQVNSWLDASPLRDELYRHDIRQYGAMLQACDAALVSTDFLAAQTQAQGKNAYVHRNAFSIEMLRASEIAFVPQRRDRAKVVIGYASGSPTHNRDFAVIKPSLRRVLKEYPQAELHAIGHLDRGDGWGPCQDRVKHLPFVPWRELPNRLAQFDINIAPLEIDNPFCQGKSEIKYMEAALVKVPTIASATDAFRHAIRHGDNGMLAWTETDWEQLLSQLIEDAEMRHVMGERAYADVLKRYHPAVRARELLTTLNEIGQHMLGRPLFEPLPDIAPANQIERERRYFQFAEFDVPPPSLLQRAWYALRYRGLRVFLLQALVFGQARWNRLMTTIRRPFTSRRTATEVDAP
jgi:glycosyltransferase involved in cell wall biosynthesis